MCPVRLVDHDHDDAVLHHDDALLHDDHDDAGPTTTTPSSTTTTTSPPTPTPTSTSTSTSSSGGSGDSSTGGSTDCATALSQALDASTGGHRPESGGFRGEHLGPAPGFLRLLLGLGVLLRRVSDRVGYDRLCEPDRDWCRDEGRHGCWDLGLAVRCRLLDRDGEWGHGHQRCGDRQCSAAGHRPGGHLETIKPHSSRHSRPSATPSW